MKTARKAVIPLQPELCRLKVGKELFTSAGPALIEMLIGRGFDIFLDLKFHDIPNTVARACAVAARMGIWMVKKLRQAMTRLVMVVSILNKRFFTFVLDMKPKNRQHFAGGFFVD